MDFLDHVNASTESNVDDSSAGALNKRGISDPGQTVSGLCPAVASYWGFLGARSSLSPLGTKRKDIGGLGDAGAPVPSVYFKELATPV